MKTIKHTKYLVRSLAIKKKTRKTSHKKIRKASSKVSNVSRNINSNIVNHKIRNGKNNEKVIMVEKTKVELLLLFNILLNYYILLVSRNLSNDERKYKLGELIMQMRNNNKLISRDTSDIQIKNIVNYLDTFFNQLLILINQYLEASQKAHLSVSHKKKRGTKNRRTHNGGFYFKSLEEKGDKPITGADLTRLLDEMQQFFYNAKYTEEGKFLQDTDTLLSMLRGDVNQFKSILQYRIFPQFYSAYPPFIKWDAIYTELIEKRRWEDLPDYLLAYQSYLRSRDEYLVEKGLKPPSVLQKDLYTGFYNKMANSINDNMYAFQNARNKFQGRFYPIALPV